MATRTKAYTKTVPRIGPRSAGMLLTPKQFDAITDYDDRYRYELIRGVLVVTPIASVEERDPNEELGHWLRSYRDHHPQGKSLDKTVAQEYVRTRSGRRLVDRLIWAGLGRLPDLEHDLPTVAVEFVSKSRRDRERDYVTKRREYCKLGIEEYWIIDRFRRAMTAVLTEAGKQREVVIQENEIYRTPRLPGFELPVRRLFDLADDWKKRK